MTHELEAFTHPPGHPLDRPGSIKILLARKHHRPSKPMETFTSSRSPDRMRHHHRTTTAASCSLCVRATKDQLDDAFRVIDGTHRAVKIREPTASSKP